MVDYCQDHLPLPLYAVFLVSLVLCVSAFDTISAFQPLGTGCPGQQAFTCARALEQPRFWGQGQVSTRGELGGPDTFKLPALERPRKPHHAHPLGPAAPIPPLKPSGRGAGTGGPSHVAGQVTALPAPLPDRLCLGGAAPLRTWRRRYRPRAARSHGARPAR